MLSRILVITCAVLLIALDFCIPYLSERFDSFTQSFSLIGGSVYLHMNITLYICDALGLCAIAALHILLRNISHEKVFVDSNTLCLRIISWACMLAGAALFLLGLRRASFWLPSFFCVMLGVVMRVLKNVFQEAVEIKTENDLTV